MICAMKRQYQMILSLISSLLLSLLGGLTGQHQIGFLGGGVV